VKEDFIKNGTYVCKACGDDSPTTSAVVNANKCYHTNADYGTCKTNKQLKGAQ
jgi:hypothetical protein